MSQLACLACVDVPALPLQLLLRRRPEWSEAPVAVLGPGGASPGGSSSLGRLAGDRVVWVNRRALRSGVRPGMRPAVADSCCPGLRIGQISVADLDAAVSLLGEQLYRWSPMVESASVLGAAGAGPLAGFGAVGTFWLGVEGLSSLYGTPANWARGLREDLKKQGFRASIAVGFTRFWVFAAARGTFGEQIFESPDEEKRVASETPLVRFGLSDQVLEDLDKLNIHRLRDLLRLSGKSLGSRYGEELRRLHRFASGEIEARASRWFRPEVPISRCAVFEPPESSGDRLVFHAKRLLHEILEAVTRLGLAVSELAYELRREDGGVASGSVLPATPHTDELRLLSLLRLRFSSEAGETEKTGVTALRLRVRTESPVSDSKNLFTAREVSGPTSSDDAGPSRDHFPVRFEPKRASEAVSRISAEFGEDALIRIESREAHLPRSRFRCRSISPRRAIPREPRLAATVPRNSAFSRPSLVRRIYDRPLPLPHESGLEVDGFLLRGIAKGVVRDFAGPYRISGGWWRRLSGRSVLRDYYFVRLRQGDILWVFFDPERRSWFLEGRVE